MTPSLDDTRPEPRRVLVVDDNADLVRLIAFLLARHGFQVRTLHDGGPVLEAARAFRPDIILLDIGLPTLSGYEVAQRLRDDPELHAVAIIAISAYDARANPDAEGRARFDRRLVKPVGFDDLLPVMASCLANA